MSMREIALGLAARGFKVFPITAGAKTPPLVAKWQTVATTSPVQIGTWWDKWPEANVGIHCDGLLVIDVDPKKGGFESLAIIEQEIKLDSTYETETPSGGRHIYYRCSTPVRNGVDVLGRGLDVRTTSGYVVAAGSRTAAGEYRVLVDDTLAECDRVIVERCAARRDDSRDRVHEASAPVATDENAASARARLFLATHPVAIQGQGGDHHTFRTICRIRDFGVDQGKCSAVLADWNARCVPPWAEDELAIKIGNAYQYAQDPAGKLTPEAQGFEILPESTTGVDKSAEKQTAAPAVPPAELLHPADVVEGDVLKVDYLLKHVLDRRTDALLFGKWHVGKTFVVLDMAASIVLGLQWFGKRARKGSVLYLGYEGIRAMKKRMLALRTKYPGLNDRSVPLRWAPLRSPLTETADELVPLFAKFKAQHGSYPDLVVIDPMMNALGGDDSDAALMGRLNRRVSEIMDRYGSSVLRVHHVGHGNDERARGHSSLPAGVDTAIRVDENEIVMTKQRDDARGMPLKFTLKEVIVGRDTDSENVTTCIVEQVEANPMDPKLTRQERDLLDALVHLRGDGGMVSKQDIKYCSKGIEPQRREELTNALTLKNYLWPADDKWRIAERGPMACFD